MKSSILKNRIQVCLYMFLFGLPVAIIAMLLMIILFIPIVIVVIPVVGYTTMIKTTQIILTENKGSTP